MEPNIERRLAAKALDLSKNPQERFLRQVFRVIGGGGHAQAERVDTLLVSVEKLLKSRLIAALSSRHEHPLMSGAANWICAAIHHSGPQQAQAPS